MLDRKGGLGIARKENDLVYMGAYHLPPPPGQDDE